MTVEAEQRLGELLLSRCGAAGRYRLGTRAGTVLNFTVASELQPGVVTLQGASIHTGAMFPTKLGDTIVVVASICWISLEPV